MKQFLTDLIHHRTLSRADAHRVLVDLASGKYNPSQISAFMTVYMMRNIVLAELEGFCDAMLELCLPVQFEEPVMDLCGTGGDGKNTFNISTLSAFVVAAAGQPVAKHGNYGVSSACGSSNVLEYFGFRFTNDADHLKRSLAQANICFLHAPLFHPAMKNVAPIRKELGVKTFFNMLGPMVNPARPARQMVGVFSLELARQYGYLYQQTSKSFAIAHGVDGYDEVSLTGDVKIFSNGGEYVWEPGELGFQKLLPPQIAGGNTVEESARIFLDVLEGRGSSAQQDVVIANASLALWVADQNQPLADHRDRAAQALFSGGAARSFRALMDVNHKQMA